MTLECKICGVSEDKILNFIINHKFPPKFIGFIVNYPKSKRFVEIDKLKNLINIDKKESKFVAVLVKPTDEILKKIQYLKFDYYQIYDCTPEEINQIKKKYNKKIISAITIENKSDLKNYKDFLPFSDIILFDSKGYEKSLGFDHNLLNDMPDNFKKMVAGNIKINDILDFKSKEYIIDLSGALEDSSGKKDSLGIRIFDMRKGLGNIRAKKENFLAKGVQDIEYSEDRKSTESIGLVTRLVRPPSFTEGDINFSRKVKCNPVTVPPIGLTSDPTIRPNDNDSFLKSCILAKYSKDIRTLYYINIFVID